MPLFVAMAIMLLPTVSAYSVFILYPVSFHFLTVWSFFMAAMCPSADIRYVVLFEHTMCLYLPLTHIPVVKFMFFVRYYPFVAVAVVFHAFSLASFKYSAVAV